MGNRFTTDFAVPHQADLVQFVTEDFFAKEGFTLINYKGEMVWKKGIGMLAAPQYIKLSYQNGWIHLEAWLKYAILPGVYCGEMGLDGFMGFAIKDALRNKVNTLMALLCQPPVQQPQYAAATPGAVNATAPANPETPVAVPQQTAPPAGYPAAPTPVMVHNPTGSATLSLVMGLVSIITWIIPILGLITTIIGITSSVRGMKTTAKGQAIAGLVLSIVFLVVSIITWILNMALIF